MGEATLPPAPITLTITPAPRRAIRFTTGSITLM